MKSQHLQERSHPNEFLFLLRPFYYYLFPPHHLFPTLCLVFNLADGQWRWRKGETVERKTRGDLSHPAVSYYVFYSIHIYACAAFMCRPSLADASTHKTNMYCYNVIAILPFSAISCLKRLTCMPIVVLMASWRWLEILDDCRLVMYTLGYLNELREELFRVTRLARGVTGSGIQCYSDYDQDLNSPSPPCLQMRLSWFLRSLPLTNSWQVNFVGVTQLFTVSSNIHKLSCQEQLILLYSSRMRRLSFLFLRKKKNSRAHRVRGARGDDDQSAGWMPYQNDRLVRYYLGTYIVCR
jgi:hypothetical protein